MEPLRVVFLVYPNVTQLDLTGPAQVLSRLGDSTVDLVFKRFGEQVGVFSEGSGATAVPLQLRH